MFILTKRPKFTAEVKFMAPSEAGRLKEVSFTGQFARLESEELEALQDKAAKGEVRDLAMARKVLVGWGEDLVDEEKQPIPFSEENKEALLADAAAMTAVVRTFFDQVRGARVKN